MEPIEMSAPPKRERTPEEKKAWGERMKEARKAKAEKKHEAYLRDKQEPVTEEEHDTAPKPAELTEQHDDRMMIHLGVPIRDAEGHQWHIKRRLVPLTPVVCTVKDCGYDLCKEFNLPPWEDIGKPTMIDSRESIGRNRDGSDIKNPMFGKEIPNPNYVEGMTLEEQKLALKQFAKHAAIHKDEQSQIIKSSEQLESWPPKPTQRLPTNWN